MKFATVEIDRAGDVTRSYGIHSLPTYLFVERGLERARAVGALDAVELRRILAQSFGGGPSGASAGRPAIR